MRGVLAACLVLLLAVEAAIGQQCEQRERVAGKKNTFDAACILRGICPSPPSSGEEECACVTHFRCSDESFSKHGKGKIIIRDGLKVCQDNLEICCPVSKVIPHGAQTVPIAPTPQRGCGQRNRNGVGVQITGNAAGEAQFGEFPWMVALLKIENDEEMMFGGGALIHPRVVITAAHNIYNLNPSSLRVRAGEWDTQTENEAIPHQELEVREVVLHEQFNKRTGYNDIALLVLRDAVLPKDNVGMLCLPSQGARATSSKCVVTGWGAEEFGKSGCFEVILKSIELPIVDRRHCERMFRKTRLGPRFNLHESFTCAGGEAGKDACTGDGGGALACPIPGDEEFYEQAGIISWGIGCGAHDVPGAYTDLSAFRDWVDAKFDARRLEKETYMRPA